MVLRAQASFLLSFWVTGSGPRNFPLKQKHLRSSSEGSSSANTCQVCSNSMTHATLPLAASRLAATLKSCHNLMQMKSRMMMMMAMTIGGMSCGSCGNFVAMLLFCLGCDLICQRLADLATFPCYHVACKLTLRCRKVAATSRHLSAACKWQVAERSFCWLD